MSQISKLEATTQLTSPNFPLMPDEAPEEFEAYRSRIIGVLKPSNALSKKNRRGYCLSALGNTSA